MTANELFEEFPVRAVLQWPHTHEIAVVVAHGFLESGEPVVTVEYDEEDEATGDRRTERAAFPHLWLLKMERLAESAELLHNLNRFLATEGKHAQRCRRGGIEILTQGRRR